MRIGPGAAMLILLTSACGLLPVPAPDWVTNREPLASCGVEEAGLGEGVDPAARQCLLEAFRDGRSAELTSTMNSVEGDPITRILRVHADGPVEIFIDATRDRFGSGRWERLACRALVPVAEVNDPPNTLYPDDWVFVEDGCEPVG